MVGVILDLGADHVAVVSVVAVAAIAALDGNHAANVVNIAPGHGLAASLRSAIFRVRGGPLAGRVAVTVAVGRKLPIALSVVVVLDIVCVVVGILVGTVAAIAVGIVVSVALAVDIAVSICIALGMCLSMALTVAWSLALAVALGMGMSICAVHIGISGCTTTSTAPLVGAAARHIGRTLDHLRDGGVAKDQRYGVDVQGCKCESGARDVMRKNEGEG